MKKTVFLLAILVVSITMLLSSCANIVPPSGGPRDSLPPKLILSLPKDSAVNVHPKMINLTFDEYVTIQGAQQALIVSPTMKTQPIVDYKLRNISIRLMDSLEANTTYSLDFGDAIRDVNEGNIAKNFNYVFSTGSTIDNNTYRGKVILAETGKVDSTLIVVLHKDLSDTAIYKLRPRYYTRLTGKGEFSFKHLPAGSFRVYAITAGYMNNYVDSASFFSFRTAPLQVGNVTKPDTLYAYEPLKKPSGPVITTTSSPVKIPGTGNNDKRLRYSVNFDNGQQDILINTLVTFNRKLTVLDSSRINLYDTNYHKLSGLETSLDTNRTQLTLKYKWKENTPYRLILQKDAVADSAGVTLSKSDTLKFFTKKESDYGSLRLRFGNLDLSRNPVLQIVSNGKIIESVPLTESEFRRRLFYAGTYDLRILYDLNKNGKWDPGNFAERKQPEIVYLVTKPISIRANWDNEINIPL